MDINKKPFFEFLKRMIIKFRYGNQRWYKEEDIDVIVVSFPKSGRTWLRIILLKIFEKYFGININKNLRLDFYAKKNKNIPLIRVAHDDKPQFKKPFELNCDPNLYKNTKVIFLARDPRDVVVSYYFELAKRKSKYNGELSEFINQETGSIKTIIKYYNIWAERFKRNNVLIVKYEDLHKNTNHEIERVLAFLGLEDIPKEVIHSAIEFSSFDNMKKLEKSNFFKSDILKPANINDNESYKVRKGKVGGYRDYLGKEEILFLNQEISEKLNEIYRY